MKHYIRDLYINTNWYLLMAGAVVLFFTSFFLPILFEAAVIYTLLIVAVTLIDYYLLFLTKGKIKGNRNMPQRFSLGDENRVTITLINSYSFNAKIGIIDEVPDQFQERSFYRTLTIPYLGKKSIVYDLRPVTRGAYVFNETLCYVMSPLQLLKRRFAPIAASEVKVYPSYLQLKKYQLMATSQQMMTGIKKVRRLGHSMEFEKIKNYVPGDDVRTINWKATARSTGLMVNTYTDARQQQIYCVIDKGRAMKMPFDGMTLLDYSINAALALLNVVILKHDRAGLITFADRVNDIIPADRRSGQINLLLEGLYKQETEYKESSFESLWSSTHRKISQRSCMILFTNFETMSALERQLPYLLHLSSKHLLCVIFFQNTLLKEIEETHPDTTEGIYIKTIADRFSYEKKQIVRKLRRHGIISILTTPEDLTVDVINKYFELKARQLV